MQSREFEFHEYGLTFRELGLAGVGKGLQAGGLQK